MNSGSDVILVQVLASNLSVANFPSRIHLTQLASQDRAPPTKIFLSPSLQRNVGPHWDIDSVSAPSNFWGNKELFASSSYLLTHRPLLWCVAYVPRYRHDYPQIWT